MEGLGAGCMVGLRTSWFLSRLSECFVGDVVLYTSCASTKIPTENSCRQGRVVVPIPAKHANSTPSSSLPDCK